MVFHSCIDGAGTVDLFREHKAGQLVGHGDASHAELECSGLFHVIGSSHGLSDEVKKAAALKFSMGRITMPHQLARLVLTEQIYRACTINAGMKYHK